MRRLLCLAVLCVSCGGPLEYVTPSSGNVAGADAKIKANVNEKRKQTQLEVAVTNLPPPERVDASSQHYVAWYRRDATVVWTRVAALAYEPDSREGQLVGSVPEAKFEFEITAEPVADAASPSPQVVFVQAIGD